MVIKDMYQIRIHVIEMYIFKIFLYPNEILPMSYSKYDIDNNTTFWPVIQF